MSLLLGNRLRKRVLGYVFTHKGEKYYVRELAAMIGEDPGNLSRELRRLETEGIFVSSIKGREKFYSLDPKYPLFEEVGRIVFKTEGVEGSLRKLLEGFVGVKTAFIYGSYAKGEEKTGSDVDLAVIVAEDFDEDKFVASVRSLERKLSREINYTAYRESEFAEKRKEKGSFVAAIVKGRKLLLKGKI